MHLSRRGTIFDPQVFALRLNMNTYQTFYHLTSIKEDADQSTILDQLNILPISVYTFYMTHRFTNDTTK